MTRDPDRTQTLLPAPPDDPALDVGLAAAFGPDSTPRGWSQPPLLRDDPSDHGPLVQPSSPEALRAASDRYQFLGEIARGGMGVILKGRDPDLGRDLAVKVLKSELAGRPAAEQRFVEEAQVCGQLQHPGVVPVHDLGRLPDGRPFFAMKLVKGRTLAAVLADRPTPAHDRGRFLKHFEKVCETIAYAHARGVIHRDLKPANVMVGSYGEVQVMDWGLAKVLPQGGVADEQRATRASRERQRPEDHDPTVIHTARSGSGAGSETLAGSVMGTPAFMPPEQAGGEIDKLDERADVFGLGAILCVILTGQPPYVGDDGDTVRLLAIRGKVDGAFARLDGCGADGELIGLCKRCLAPERDARPRHAGQVAAAVTAYLHAVEDRAHRAEIERAKSQAKTAEERKRRRVQLAFAASVLGMVALAGGGGWYVQKQMTDRERAEGERARQEQAAREEEAVRAERARLGVEQALVQLGDLYRRGLWDQADGALAKTETFLGPDADPDLRAKLDQAKRDTAFLRRLDDIRMRFGEQFDPAATAREYAAAFREYGLDPDGLPPSEMARRVREHPHAEPVTAAAAALLNHARVSGEGAYWDAVLDAVYPADTFYGRWRAADRSPDAKGVLRLAEQADPAELTPTTIWLMSLNLHFRQPSQAAAAVRLLRAGLARYPSDFWLHYELCTVSLRRMTPPRLEDGIRHGTAAVALRPGIARAHHELGFALWRYGDLDRAEAEYREAIRLDPTFVSSYSDLEMVLRAKGDSDGALAASKEAVRLNPTDPGTHIMLGWALADRGDLGGAIAAYREALRVQPTSAWAHVNLGKGLLQATGDLDGALAALREAVRLDPKSSYARWSLVEVERVRSVAHRLDAVRAGEKVTKPDEMIRLGELAGQPFNRDYALAFRLFTDAFAALERSGRPILRRYDAARAAVRMAAGEDRGGPIGVEEWYYLQKQARDLLAAELASGRRLAWSGTPAERKRLASRYETWQLDPGLRSVRDPRWRACMPADERTAWGEFWTEVEVVRKVAVMALPYSLPEL